MNSSKAKRKSRKASEMPPIKLTLIAGGVGSIAFGIAQSVGDFGDWVDFRFYSFLGLLVGFMAAPEFAPKRFKLPLLWQALCGGVGGYALSQFRGFEGGYVVLSILVGMTLGLTAQFWLKHAQIP